MVNAVYCLSAVLLRGILFLAGENELIVVQHAHGIAALIFKLIAAYRPDKGSEEEPGYEQTGNQNEKKGSHDLWC